MEKLIWRVLNKTDFNKEVDYLYKILQNAGIDDVNAFLNVNESHTHNPFLFKNINKGLELLHNNLGKKIFVKVDSDADGFTSSSYVCQILKDLNSNTEIEYGLNYKKEHGIFYKDVKDIKDLSLIIVPDAGSDSIVDCKEIKEKTNIPILILDHHEINPEIHDYATVINCKDGEYPNQDLSGVGVVHKFFLAYCEQYGLNKEMCNEYLDLVALGMVADLSDMRSLETRYYTLEGLKDCNRHNLLIKEMAEKFAEEEKMKLGHTIASYGWVIAPKINGVVRYGKPEEQLNLFRAMKSEQEDIEYQPRRKSKHDPKPPKEIHSLQKTMARVSYNVKQRQDTQVRKFMKAIDEQIIKEKKDRDSVIIVDGSDILEKQSVSGLVANKLIDKYKRPIVILKPLKDNPEMFGGSARGYDKCKITDFRQFLLDLNLFDMVAGHDNASGVRLSKDKLETVRKKCNQLLDINDLVTVHEVDYEIKADKLNPKSVLEVAKSFAIWSRGVKEPEFVITDIYINASEINGYGDNNTFIKFNYNNVDFIKKYCSKDDYEQMTLRDRRTLGKNTKDLKITVIGNFITNFYEGKEYPQVKIKYFHTEEVKEKPKHEIDIDDIF